MKIREAPPAQALLPRVGLIPVHHSFIKIECYAPAAQHSRSEQTVKSITESLKIPRRAINYGYRHVGAIPVPDLHLP
jgi:hypothetical protein